MDNEDIDAMNTYMDNLNSCLNDYAKENDDPDNPLTALLVLCISSFAYIAHYR